MKQLFTFLLLASALLAKSNPNHGIEPAAVKNFEAAYGKATNATWRCTPAGCQVRFEHKGQTITAVYTHAGQLRWYQKHIASTQLPSMLQLKLKNYVNGYWIADVQETSGRNGASYTLTLENGLKKVTLNATGGNWQIVKTSNKA